MILGVLNPLIYMFIGLAYAALKFMETYLSEIQKYNFFGFLIIILFGLLLLVNVIFGLI